MRVIDKELLTVLRQQLTKWNEGVFPTNSSPLRGS